MADPEKKNREYLQRKASQKRKPGTSEYKKEQARKRRVKDLIKNHPEIVEDVDDDENFGPGVSDLVANALEQKPVDFQSDFNELLKDKISAAVAQRKLDLASTIAVEEPEDEGEVEEEPEADDEYEYDYEKEEDGEELA